MGFVLTVKFVLRLTAREVMLASSSREDIIVPLTRLCCPLSLVVAQSLKNQVSYFLDELSMLYRLVFNPRNKSDKHHEKSD
ncbi:hypothetical protein LWI28_015418 [Acer negundo]|uniref:Secreted protein n=1 Tax=Acer negundo TaxID=4023 RepID=A0AAD5NEW3_ACENE|nr:hypothetical protein LWI28_015418 [Acer negundo]